LCQNHSVLAPRLDPSCASMTPAMRIVYRIVDEYGTRLRFKPGQSTQPLSMRELIALN